LSLLATIVFIIVFFCLVLYPIGYYIIDGLKLAGKKMGEWYDRQ
jgi:hypothetical protein